MSLNEILLRIKVEGEAEAQKILKNAENEALRIRTEYAEKLTKADLTERKKHEHRITELRNVHLAQAHREERQIKLRTKEEMIDECFSQLRTELERLTGDDYARSLKTMLEEGVRLIGDNYKARVVREEDKAVVQNYIAELESTGNYRGSLETGLLQKENIAGIYIESADGKKIVDNTYSAILERKREFFRIEMSRILFENQ